MDRNGILEFIGEEISRLERAKELLVKEDARVLDVAIACGFQTQQHFARVFRAFCKMSPTQFRQARLA